MEEFESIGIATSSMLVELSISCWTGRKLDKAVSNEIDASKHTKVRAGNYHKHLFAGNHQLDAVIKYAANVRLWNTKRTSPWSDAGGRIVTMENLFAGGYKQELDTHRANYLALADNFKAVYPTLVSAMAFQLGDLFNRDEYPEPEELDSKFKFEYTISPLPTSGDFRIDIGEQAKAELIQHYEEHFNKRLNTAMRDVWDRLHSCLIHMSDRLGATGDGKRKVFHSTLLSNANELVDLLSKLNITKDVKLEQARRELADALNGASLESLKESDYMRETVKSKVDSIISKFEW